jgi:2-oxoisovalerate dehydrogenase E1 component alpha subunit
MLLARRLDDEMWRLARAGQAHFAVPCAGHEAVAAGYALALRRGHDFVAPHYRDLAAMLVLGLTPRDVMLHFFARDADPCSRGRQPYAHWGSARWRIVTLQGPQPNHVSHGVGIAWGSRLLGEDSVTWISFGDGGAQKGEVHEAMNIAAIHRLPCVFFVETNGYTQSVPLSLESSQPDIVARAGAYSMPGWTVDGLDVQAVYRVSVDAVAYARSGAGPCLVEAKCYRYRPNTSNDDDSRYRSASEVEIWRALDPVLKARAVLPLADAIEVEHQVQLLVTDAVEWAQAQPSPDPSTVMEHTYA